MEAKYIKTEILLDDGGKEFDFGRATRRPAWLKTLLKEEALDLFEKGKPVYFIYESERIYKANCRKVCKNKEYLSDHYFFYKEVCGVLAKTIELCTFPKDDADYCLSFIVPQTWLIKVIKKEDERSGRKPTSLNKFLDNYCWDETYFIYEAAKTDGVLLKEEIVK